ncbi:MAG: phosphate/phosphite/phosphonate ABC transporter substrate-binding protein [Syntrophobacteraceae bacterium]|jgi:ABC-type phosphate/phosphonate transport system substrate-binding protein
MPRKTILFVPIVLVLLLAPSLSFSSEEYTIGVLCNRGGYQALKEWKSAAVYLSEKLGKHFSIVPLGDKQLRLWTKEGRLDFIYTNPAQYSDLAKLYGIVAIATVVSSVKHRVLTDQVGSVIFVRRDSPINEAADLKGKDFMCSGLETFGGWRAANCFFVENGINPQTDFSSFKGTASHPNVVYAVLYGAVHAGAVRTGTLELMAAAGEIKMEDFKVIHPIGDDFPLLHSTSLYTEFPIAASSRVPQEIRDRVAEALFALLPYDPASVAAKITDRKKQLDYVPVIDCICAFEVASSPKVQ